MSWTDPANWDPEHIPGPEDDLAFPDAPDPYTVEVSSVVTVKSVRLNEKVILNFNLGGTTAGDTDDQHDQLAVIKGITLGGSTLQVTLANGFVPVLGDSFTLITEGRRLLIGNSIWGESGSEGRHTDGENAVLDVFPDGIGHAPVKPCLFNERLGFPSFVLDAMAGGAKELVDFFARSGFGRLRSSG